MCRCFIHFFFYFSAQFKTRLSKQELRSFHRPQLSFPPNIESHFSRVKAGKKKKKDKKKDPSEIMRSSKDLTLKDNSFFVLVEYSVGHGFI